MSLFTGPVLILDNDELTARAVERSLTLLGIEVSVFITADSAIAGYQQMQISGQVPQVALIDGALGGDLTGVDIAAIIANMDTDNKTALIGYSSYAQVFVGEIGFKSRIEGVIEKTDDIQLLILQVEAVLQKRQQIISENSL